ncbi:MAG TPA: hypothetical protein VK027_05780 [Chitinophagaceae bacterium]|nr:hypothetical protein [Chitinophagaceae bacterium]
MEQSIFIFVVCGAREHIDTLHFSLKYLKKFSKYPIWILTDSSRNEIPIVHDTIIDIKTPKDFDHHQASIYLKTGIHQFVPKGNTYCYLDTDIIALNSDINNIFKEYLAPISFAPDHCVINEFAPYAVYCACLKEQEYRERLSEVMDKKDKYRLSNNEEIIEARREWQEAYENKNKSFWKKLLFGFTYLFSRNKFYLTDTIYCDRKNNVWIKNDNIAFMHQINMFDAAKEAGLKWNVFKMQPISPNGKELWKPANCPHLQEEIYKKFNIKVADKFQHWNGGVFLFDDKSHDFLERWFTKTMDIFKDSAWKTRDQGTLIATVWKMGLEAHPVLDKKWNLIADFYNPQLKWVDKNTLQLSEKEQIKPNFLHVYHHFGDENWKFWKEIPVLN